MTELYFSERELGVKPRIGENISLAVWGGIVAITEAALASESFGNSFPWACPDGQGIAGADRSQFSLALAADIPGMKWPLDAGELPELMTTLDFLEFCHSHVAKPIEGSFHSFFKHSHLSFDIEAGQKEFRQRINRVFERNGVAYELEASGRIIRLAPEILREALQTTVFDTGDTELDALLESARTKFLSPNGNIRREALEKLWDAWERIKTVEPGPDKRASVKALLDKAASEPKFRELLEQEARALTEVGNAFRIRHSETSQTALQKNEHVDYLFHRLFGLVRMLLVLRSASAN